MVEHIYKQGFDQVIIEPVYITDDVIQYACIHSQSTSSITETRWRLHRLLPIHALQTNKIIGYYMRAESARSPHSTNLRTIVYYVAGGVFM